MSHSEQKTAKVRAVGFLLDVIDGKKDATREQIAAARALMLDMVKPRRGGFDAAKKYQGQDNEKN